MLRSRLKNIINKSKELSKKLEVGNPFDEFKKSLPIEIDDNYRLESAWKAYGSPKDYKEALWQGLIQPIDENNIKLPSIGYNEETDEYEYLNKGRENETVDKDIRVWDNDVIPLVKELKLGGFIRVYDEEKDCWKYSKNKPQETLNELGEVIELFKQGGQMNVIPEGALHARKNNMEGAGEDFTAKGIPVISEENGEILLLAEIERNEVIFNHSTTTKLEELYKKFNNTDKESEKNEIAIKAGKILTYELINNTQDNTRLILEVAEKNNLDL